MTAPLQVTPSILKRKVGCFCCFTILYIKLIIMTVPDFLFQQVLRAFKGILNKLTPEKYKKLTEDVQQLNINSEERLSGVTDLVFEKVRPRCWS